MTSTSENKFLISEFDFFLIYVWEICFIISRIGISDIKTKSFSGFKNASIC